MTKLMKMSCVGLMLLGLTAFSPSDAPSDEHKAVRLVIDQIFDAMRAGDAEAIKSLVLEEALLDRIAPGKPVEHGKLSGWTDWVATLKPGQADEQIFDVVIQVEGPLATAWAPFTIAINGELKSCGVNHFAFVKTDAGWKVSYLIDTHTPEKCMK